jgi:hypothetical protein
MGFDEQGESLLDVRYAALDIVGLFNQLDRRSFLTFLM